MSTITLRLLQPDEGTRLLWQSVDAVLDRYASEAETGVAMGGAALGLCLGYPLVARDLTAYGDAVIRSLALRMDAEQIGRAVEAALLLVSGDAQPQARPEPPEPASAKPAGNPQGNTGAPWGPPVVPDPPDGASLADYAMWQRARWAPGPGDVGARVEWRHRWHALMAEDSPIDPKNPSTAVLGPDQTPELSALPDDYWAEDDGVYTHTIDGALAFCPPASSAKIKALAYDKVKRYGASKRYAVYLSAREVLGAIAAQGVKRFLYHHEPNE